ncbi:carboxypeptidase regulatory-like domain-containing protein [Xylanimonas ulmi]|uniref:Subtilisin family serine protease n=1 Tax=Xylanimonas ulmi TaxID=228973 RepID=A0A4Q7M3S7_9MICO|nr:carboxypeptidase regulatory-like domain-containing protein [Xylanibacterium ulmi]RZS62595.1 subtilisin family serine protease [Xylanibacterium ulmi]
MQRRHSLAGVVTTAVCAVVTLAATTAVGLAPAAAAPAGPSVITADVASNAEDKFTTAAADALSKGQKADFWVKLADKADLSAAKDIADWNERGQYVYDTLTKVAAESQKDVVAQLDAAGADYEPFWISNRVLVKDGDLALATALAAAPAVKEIHETVTIEPEKPVAERPSSDKGLNAPEWGLVAIHAPEAWAMGATGAGIVVSSVDSGVDGHHPALESKYRGYQADGTFDNDYNFFDTSGSCGPSGDPCDADAHGTHTMGTMVGSDGGSNQIGVAPGAQWVEANGCATCEDADLLEAGEWQVAPTRTDGSDPDPSKRPNIVNNSWGYRAAGTIDDWYADIVTAWEAAGIFGAWSAGNSGPTCSTTSSPGANTIDYSAGAFDSSGQIAYFSSRGPGEDGLTKPNLAAPGVNVRSSVPGGGYANYDGTSMAAPHLAGAVALLWSYAPSLVGDIEGTKALLDQTAVDVDDTSCGGTAADNNVWGEGKLDVVALLEAAPHDAAGTVSGTVTSQGAPVAGATVVLDGENDRTLTTDANGAFEGLVTEGDYTATASAYGLLPQTEAVTVTADETTTVDFDLAAAPTHTVSGTVTDAVTGAAVAGASIQIAPGGLAATSGADGTYAVSDVPEGSYTLTATAGACAEPVSLPLTVDGDETLDVALQAGADDYGYFCTVSQGAYLQGTTKLPLTGDDVTGSIALPFAFSFYGKTYSTGYLTSNGHLNFLAATSSYSNGAIPAAAAPNAAIYPFWDDLYLDADAGVYTASTTVDGVAAFTIEWRNVRKYSPNTDRLNFSVTLLADGRIILGYGALTDTSTAHGDSATVGIENAEGTVASQYSLNAPVLHEGLTITYDLPPQGTVAGTIKDYNTKAPVAGATVTATSADGDVKDATTAADGTYELLLFEGRWTVEVSASGYEGASKAVAIAEGSPKTFNAQLKAGQLAVSTTAINANLAIGGSVSRNVRVTNNGSAPVEVNLGASGDEFAMLGSTSSASQGVIKGVEGKATVAKTAGSKFGAAAEAKPGSGLTTNGKASKLAGSATSVTPAAPVIPAGEVTLTHSTSQNIVTGNAAACPGGPTQWLRTFTLADFGISGGLDVSAVSFGVESNAQAQPITVNLYTLAGDLVYANMTKIGTATTQVAAGSGAMVTVPVTGTVPAGGTLVAEVVAPIGGTFYIGSNAEPETAPSYLASTFCQTPDPATSAEIGFPDMHVVLNVTGQTTGGGSGVAWLDVQPPTFTLQPGKSVVAVATMTADVDQPGAYSATITVGAETPYENPSVTATMTVKQPAGWGKVTGTVTNAAGEPLSGAVVSLDGVSYDITLITGEDGTYAYWFQKANGPLQVTVSAQGYVPQTKKAQIVAGQTTVYDFALKPLP